MKVRILLLSALLATAIAQAQPGSPVDCNCVATLHELQTNACQAVIPDLCAVVAPCVTPSPIPFMCSQNPAAGTPVGPGTYPITLTITDPFNTNNSGSCLVNFVVTPPPGGCGCVPPPAGLVGWWPLDEPTAATLFADFSGNGNGAIVESGSGGVDSPGSPNSAAGKVAAAKYFYGLTVRGRAPNSPSLNFGAGDFTVDCWINPVLVGPVAWQPIADKLDQPTASTAFGYAVGITNNRVALRVGNGVLQTRESASLINFGTWNFIAVTVDRSANTVRFHVNGYDEPPQALAISGSINSSVDLYVGGTHATGSPVAEFTLDELELFNRALTTNEVQALWLADSAGKCKTNQPCSVTISCPPSTNVEVCATSAVVFYPNPLASSTCGPITNLVCVPPSGSIFPLGTTTVTCTATDSQGHTASCVFYVTVTSDRTPPSCPPTSISVTGCPPLVPDFATNGLVTDNCTPVGQISVVQNPLPGTVLPPGLTLVTLTACDAASNCVSCVVAITAVYSGALPVVTCSSNIVATGYYSCASNGLRVIFPTAQVTNGTLVGCSPPSGSLFPFGLTTVTCTATNACGTSQCSFTVTVNFGGIEPPCVPIPSNLVMWLTFDEPSGLIAVNSSAGNNGILVNGPTRNPGSYVQSSLCFDGVNDFVQVKPYPAIQFGTGDFSVDAWIKPATLDNTVRVIVDHREENGPVVRGYSFFLGGGNTLGFQIADGTFINYPSTLVVPADGQWHLVAVTVKRNDPQGIRFYLDGVQGIPGRDPTGHPGSVTAGPCYPLRVGSRSSSVSGLFNGCIDEVELVRRAMRPDEILGIYNASCKGKCRISCQQSRIDLPCGAAVNTSGIVHNPSTVDMTFNYSWQGLPAGPGCDVAGPTSFTPASGSVYVPAGFSVPIPVQIVQPPGMTNGNCCCFQLELTSTDGSVHLICPQRMCAPRGAAAVCATLPESIIRLTNLEPTAVHFLLSGAGPAATLLNDAHIVLSSPEQAVVGVWPVPPTIVPPAGGGTVEIPHSFAFPEYDPGRFYRLTLEADLDADGVYEVLVAVPVINVIPPTYPGPELEIRQLPNGGVIIIWPDPCAILEQNPNLFSPAGWTTAPVQTSPWTFTPAPGSKTFYRLRQ